MEITRPEFSISATAIGVRSRPGVTGNATLGASSGTVSMTGADVAYCLRLTMGNGGSATLTTATGAVTGTAAGTSQVETATAAGTATGAGNVAVTIVAANYAAANKTINVAIANADDASAWATKVRAALTADADVNAKFAISGAGADIILTDRLKNANDATLNIALANGTPDPGITPAATSANTTAGVASVAYESVDFEGNALPGCEVRSVLLQAVSGKVEAYDDSVPAVFYQTLDARTQAPVWSLPIGRTAAVSGYSPIITISGFAPGTVLDIHIFGDAL